MIRRHLPALCLVAGVAWIVLVTALIAGSPEAGAADPVALAAAYQQALSADDASAVTRLLDDGSMGTASRLLEEATCEGARPRIEVTGDHLTLRSAGGVVCGEVPITQRGGRWYLAT